MKKSLISGIAMIAMTVGAANADKQSCDNSPKNIWDEKDQVCVPRDPCHSRLYKNNTRYCNRAFRKTQVGDVDIAKRLINIYVQSELGSRGHCKEFLAVNGDGTPKHIGDDYIGCITQEGAFVSFQFDDVSESFDKVSDGNFYRAACVVLGGSPDGVMPDAVRKAAMAAEVGVGAVGAVALAPAVATVGVAAGVGAAAVIDQAAAASVSGCAGITRKQCEMIDPLAGYNENTKLCQFVR